MKDVNILINNGINVQKSLELLGDMKMYEETLNDFLEAVEMKKQDLQKYKESGDMNNYAIQAHSLKSDAKYLGFEKLAEIAYDHELKGKANDLYYITDHYNELVNETNKIINIVKSYFGNSVIIEEAKQEIKKDKSILVVDDSTIINNYIHKIFNDEFNVLLAHDGGEAIELVKQNLDNSIIAMLLDLNMPNVDGFAVLEYFKENNLFKKIPVAIITGDDSKDVIDRAFTYNIIDVIGKPFNELNIKLVIEKAKRANQ